MYVFLCMFRFRWLFKVTVCNIDTRLQLEVLSHSVLLNQSVNEILTTYNSYVDF